MDMVIESVAQQLALLILQGSVNVKVAEDMRLVCNSQCCPKVVAQESGYSSTNPSPKLTRKTCSPSKRLLMDETPFWNGELPGRTLGPTVFYSSKVFVGGIPWDIHSASLTGTFSRYGECVVEWAPKGEAGYAYIIYENRESIPFLLSHCEFEAETGRIMLTLSCKRVRSKEIRKVEIKPWSLEDSYYKMKAGAKRDVKKTIFVGGVHGMITAHGLAKIFNDTFSGVVYASIDTDRYKYPIGCGRLSFDNKTSYRNAMDSGVLQINAGNFTKTVQIYPYLVESLCFKCSVEIGKMFCRQCGGKYLCAKCWKEIHQGYWMIQHKAFTKQ